MIPPTSIDGTDITGATIDGTDVQEITVDGDTVFSAIPDSVVSREPDDLSFSFANEAGLKIETKSQWPSIGARISQNTTGATRAYLWDSSKSVIDSVDISSLSPGNAFTFDNVNLQPNVEFYIVLDAEGNSFNLGFANVNPGNYPYTSTDVDIIGRDVNDGREPRGVNDIGNVGF